MFQEILPPATTGSLSPEAARRVGNLMEFSPLYRNFLRRFPDFALWLDRDCTAEIPWRFNGLLQDARHMVQPATNIDQWFQLLRRFRRKQSMRLTYRTVNQLGSVTEILEELTLLGEVTLKLAWEYLLPLWIERFGEPWLENEQRRCTLVFLALGKFGGRELNFCSDLDLILMMESEGYCRKNDRETATSNGEFYTRACRDLISRLQETTDEGFLYHIDLRLRPEGDQGPLIRTQSGLENYYFSAGQTWERLAMIRARPVAGDIDLGEELLENLQSFRYPRHPPPSLLREVASLKTRIEKELLGKENLDRNLKTGHGGIREIEFVVQALQLLHAGKFPFLQTHKVVSALAQLARYGILEYEETDFLETAYLFFRQIENLIQMREEQQTHLLPTDLHWETTFASLFQLPVNAFITRLSSYRKRVREIYCHLFEIESESMERETDWWLFFTGNPPSAEISEKLETWFPREQDRENKLRIFLTGGPNRPMYRELLHIFLAIEPHLDHFLPKLAFPLRALGKISDFAERYGARRHFFNACTTQPRLVEMLGLLFDRSQFLHSILSNHPEILDELLVTDSLHKTKSGRDHHREIHHFLDQDDWVEWLWLYVKAEQVRLSIAQLLGTKSLIDAEEQLSRLATATIQAVFDKLDPQQQLAVVGLGKLGGGELSLGSDLDLMILTENRGSEELQIILRKILKLLAHSRETFPLYEVDLRLRPHGNDGPQLVTIESLQAYYQGEKKSAQPWEFLVLTRSRWLRGPQPLHTRFQNFREEVLYKHPPSAEDLQEIWRVRTRLEHEKFQGSPAELAYKTGPGGLVDVEFVTQILSWQHGQAFPVLRSPSTRALLQRLATVPAAPTIDFDKLAQHYAFLKEVEWNLRRNEHKPSSLLPEDPDQRFALAKWLGFDDFETFMARHKQTMEQIRNLISPILK